MKISKSDQGPNQVDTDRDQLLRLPKHFAVGADVLYQGEVFTIESYRAGKMILINDRATLRLKPYSMQWR